jgi:hypothetical protein
VYVTPGAIIYQVPHWKLVKIAWPSLHMLMLVGELKNALWLLALCQQPDTFFVPSVIM